MKDTEIETLAGILYEELCLHVGGVAYNGEPLPKWTEFRADPRKQKQSDSWVAVARRAAELGAELGTEGSV
jgi:hypothetical protein